MSVWKQILVCLVVLVAAAAAWARFFPGASDVLARYGIDWAVAARQAPPESGSREGRPEGRGGPGGGFGAAPLVVTAPVTYATINDRLSAIGTGRALSSVVVTPFAAGRLMELSVRSAADVEAGEVIAKLDSQAEEIAVDRARIALDDAEARLERVTALRASNTVTAVQQTEAELAVDNARLQLREAELALDRRSVVAPISGVAGILPVTVGNHVTPQTEIATIDDRSEILVDFWVPERFAGAITLGMPVTATSVARGDEVFEGEVSAVDNRIDPESRTLRVEARLTNPKDTLRAGMSFEVEMQFAGDTFPAVNPLAVQWSADGAFIWTVDDATATRVPIRIVQRNTDTILVDAELSEGQQVVTEGVHAVREGGEVQVVNNAVQPPVAGTGTTAPRGS
jgi:RND family efflux transporter MFP subunit